MAEIQQSLSVLPVSCPTFPRKALTDQGTASAPKRYSPFPGLQMLQLIPRSQFSACHFKGPNKQFEGQRKGRKGGRRLADGWMCGWVNGRVSGLSGAQLVGN